MSSFDDLMSEVLEATGDETIVSRIKEATAASPLRKERDEWKTKAEQIAEEAKGLKDAVLQGTFKQAGIGINPAALAIPADLDFKSAEAVRAWGESMGLVAPATAPPTPQEQQNQIARTGGGANSAAAIDKPALQVQSAKSLKDLVSQAQASGWSGRVN